MDKHDLKPDTELSPEQANVVKNLTEFQIEDIDSLLFSSTSDHFKKVAMVVGSAMMEAKKNTRVYRIYTSPNVYVKWLRTEL